MGTNSCGVSPGETDEAGGDGKETNGMKLEEPGETPIQYTMQALWGGKMTAKDFEVADMERPTLAHNVFEQDEALPVIDIAALRGTSDAGEANLVTMLDAAKTWGFFKIRNHGVRLQVVPTLTHSPEWRIILWHGSINLAFFCT